MHRYIAILSQYQVAKTILFFFFFFITILLPFNFSILLLKHIIENPLQPTISGFSLTPYLESFTPTFGLGTPVFQRISSNLHSGTPTFLKIRLWDSCFQNPSENPAYDKRTTLYHQTTVSFKLNLTVLFWPLDIVIVSQYIFSGNTQFYSEMLVLLLQ